MKIVFEEGCEVKQELTDIMLKAATKALECEGLNDADCIEVSLSFVSPEEIKEINNQFRGIDKVTDVLSFPQFEDLSDLDELIEDEEVKEISLGDVVICTKRASEQAEEFGHSLDRELVYLFVHSILHLLGYDHMEKEEKAEMRAREEEIMQFVDLPRA